jgi:hypothetical protein
VLKLVHPNVLVLVVAVIIQAQDNIIMIKDHIQQLLNMVSVKEIVEILIINEHQDQGNMNLIHLQKMDNMEDVQWVLDLIKKVHNQLILVLDLVIMILI